MNKDSWIALIIASLITIIATTPLYYSLNYVSGSKGKMSEGSGTTMTGLIEETKENTEPTH